MRCDGFLLAYDETIYDPKFKGCVSHAECIQWEDRFDKKDSIVVETTPVDDDLLKPINNSTSVDNNKVNKEDYTSDTKLDETNDVSTNNFVKKLTGE